MTDFNFENDTPTTQADSPLAVTDCPACGSSTTVDHNGFDICDNSGVPKEHCQLSAQDVNQT